MLSYYLLQIARQIIGVAVAGNKTSTSHSPNGRGAGGPRAVAVYRRPACSRTNADACSRARAASGRVPGELAIQMCGWYGYSNRVTRTPEASAFAARRRASG